MKLKRRYRRENEEVDFEITESFIKIRKKLKIRNKIKSRSVSLDSNFYGEKLFVLLGEYLDEK
ncbi:hypothetical protein J7J18_07130, partial [bacterium]|nr:hypothetical protein [bacterium]